MGSKDEQYDDPEIELEQTPPFEELAELRRQQQGNVPLVGEQDRMMLQVEPPHNINNNISNVSHSLKSPSGFALGEPSYGEAGEYEIEPIEQGEALGEGIRERGEGAGGAGGGEAVVRGLDEDQLQIQLQGMQEEVRQNGGKMSIEENLQDGLENGILEQKHRPYFVVLVIVVCTIMYLISMAMNGWKIAPLNENPMVGPDSSVLIELGAKVTELIVGGEWWRLIAPMFLHAGLIHLLVNMITLWRLGSDLEETFGPFRIGAIYFLSGLFGILMSAIFLPEIPGVGASGAICGLLGAKLGDFFHYHKYLQEGKWKYLVSLVLSTVISLAIGLFPLIDNFGHVGGWICGLLSGTVFLAYAVKDPNAGRQRWRSAAVLFCLLLLITFFVCAFAVLYSSIDGNTWCSWCANISCIRGIPWWDCSKQYCQVVAHHYPNGTTVYDCEPI